MFHVPLLAKGITPNNLKEPLKALNAVRLDDVEGVFKLVADVSSVLAREAEAPDAYHQKILHVVRLAKPPVEAPPGVIRALARFNAANADNRHS